MTRECGAYEYLRQHQERVKQYITKNAFPLPTRAMQQADGKKPLLPSASDARKEIPMARGLLDYFPAALAEVARVSFLGNEKHNPGQPLHWSRDKSTDHADCIVRHLAERGRFDVLRLPNGKEFKIRHSAYAAWRALALLQIELEEAGETGVAITPIDQRGKPE